LAAADAAERSINHSFVAAVLLLLLLLLLLVLV
jgi:hypothetical protein